MTNFEFVFSLLSILLGLALAEVLGGLARAVKARPRVRIGWATGLLATWTLTETVILWRITWRARDSLPDHSAALFGGFAVCALYYFAAALLFPERMEGDTSLDQHFDEEKTKIIGALLLANFLAYALRWAAMGRASFSYMAWYDVATLLLIYTAGAWAMLTKRRGVAIGCLALLVLLDLADPVEALLWPT